MAAAPSLRWQRIAVIASAAFTAGGGHSAAAAPPALHAEPQVAVIELAPSSSGSGAIVLHNDSASTVAADRITAEPGCDSAVQATPLTGFSLAPGATRAITVSCLPAPIGRNRCGYTVRSLAGTALLGFEAVCSYAGSTALSAAPSAIDFGVVAVGGSASRSVVLSNPSPSALDHLFLTTTDLAGNFTLAAPCNPDARECDAAIARALPGATTSVVVSCTPRSVGPETAQLYIATSAGTHLAAPIALSCTGIAASAPVLSATPSAIDVGQVELVNATAGATVQVGNAGTGTLKLLDVQIVDSGTAAAADWSYTAAQPCNTAIPPGCNLDPGQTVDLNLAFDPSAIAVRNATLLIHYHDTADRSASIPLRGSGGGATLDLIGGSGASALDFGTLPFSATAALSVSIANRGTRALGDGAISVIPSGPPFSVAPTSSFSVATAAPTAITVSCKPTAPGPFSADLQLTAPDVQSPAIHVALRCAGDSSMAVIATPPAIQLGEVRTSNPVTRQVAITSLAAPIALGAATLDTVDPSLALGGVPATTPATLGVTAAPQIDGSLTNRVTILPATGPPPLALAITGTAVTANYSAPPSVSLGTFCVQQPTTSRILQLSSIATASIALSPPVLADLDSPFDLEIIAPLGYPATLSPGGRATIAATPKRRAIAGAVSDDVIWTTDVTDLETARTRLTASFVDAGPAIAPAGLSFAQTPIHLDIQNAQEVTLQNCDPSPLQLDPPQVPAPYSIDSPNFPSVLLPGETTAFSVGFHPTKTGRVDATLIVTSPQLRDRPLKVALTGEGVATGGSNGIDSGPSGDDRTSFYACTGCASHDPSGALACVAAALCIALRRRRRQPRR
jgi:hypothetical protein